jgi:hypothetical protein
VAVFIHNPGAQRKFPEAVVAKAHENLLMFFILLIAKAIIAWLKNGHFNNRAAESGLRRDLQQIIHKVIHNYCG